MQPLAGDIRVTDVLVQTRGSMWKWAFLSSQSLTGTCAAQPDTDHMARTMFSFLTAKELLTGAWKNYCTKYWAAHTTLAATGSVWDSSIKFPVTINSVCGVRHTTPNSSTLCYFLLIFPELIPHDHKLWVLLHPFTLFILKIYPKMVFHSYL